jgi:RNA-directed DNA polymerase
LVNTDAPWPDLYEAEARVLNIQAKLHQRAVDDPRRRRRVGDKRVLGLVKAFLKAGVLGEDQVLRDSVTGTPQGGILSPLLANIALSVLDEHFVGQWESFGGQTGRSKRRRQGLANYRLVRYADDFVVLLTGAKEHVEALREEVAAVLAPMGLRLSEEITLVTHIDQGFDFLGFHVQRKRQQGSKRTTIYTYPSKAALAAVKARVRVLTQGNTDQTLANLLDRVNPVLRGWANYFRHGVSARTFSYLNAFSWRRVVNWLRQSTPGPAGAGSASTARPGGGRQTVKRRCSTRLRCRSFDTATGGPTSRRRGRAQKRQPWHSSMA